MIRKPLLLLILDGWGLARDPTRSAIERARTPFIDGLYLRYPHSRLAASGHAVGLPEGQMGNSEVGHIHIGAGRMEPQELMRIDRAIRRDAFYSHAALGDALTYARQSRKRIHLMGLLSDGGIHSHIAHLEALLSVLQRREARRVFVHAFTDGRDTDPHSGTHFLDRLYPRLQACGGRLASVTGRYFAMDRNRRWERTKKAYDALAHGVGACVPDLRSAVADCYAKGVTDEFLPSLLQADADGKPLATIGAGDVVLFFNFRTDRGRQLTEALTQRAMPQHNMRPLPLHYLTMTRYDDAFRGVQPLFDKRPLSDTLGETLSRAGKTQLRVAETEKYPHVTFFFSGGREEPFPGERRILCPSPPVATYDLKPEMSIEAVTQKTVEALTDKAADFLCVNFANPDMVGHTGVMDAAVRACEAVDACTGKVVKAAQAHGYAVLVIADHGNVEQMLNEDGTPHTAHTLNPAPCILVDDDYVGALRHGALGDVAPTALNLMGMPVPAAMTGAVLLSSPYKALR